MRVALLARYPRVDTVGWKRHLVSELRETGMDVSIAYTRASLADQARAGLKEFGPKILSRYASARHEGEGKKALPLSEWARIQGIDVIHHPGSPNAEFATALSRLHPDIVVLAGADIVPRTVLEVPRIGTLNPHYGLLPRYRGMNVAEWSIYQDDPVGVSVHFVDEGIDTGDIAARATIQVEAGDELADVRAKQQRLSAVLLCKVIASIADGTVDRTPQRLDEGRQYYRMHPALLVEVQRKLSEHRYRWLGGGTASTSQ